MIVIVMVIGANDCDNGYDSGLIAITVLTMTLM